MLYRKHYQFASNIYKQNNNLLEENFTTSTLIDAIEIPTAVK